MKLAPLVLLAACGRDIYLGERTVPPPDAMLDAATARGPFIAGTYAIAFLDPADANCMGTLTGNEADFSTVTRSSLALVDGSITLATPDDVSLVVAGAPIENRLGRAVTLVPDQSDPLWAAQVDGSFGSGADATTITSIAFAADSTTGTSASGVEAAIAFLFETTDTNGACSIDFRALLTKS